MGKVVFYFLAPVLWLAAIFLVLQSDHALVFQPKGLIAHRELKLILINLALMALILVPTYVWLVTTSHAKVSQRAAVPQWVLWALPSVIVAVMAIITWDKTHELDPYKPIESDQRPMTIQVVALDWKWLFIYPEQGIATVNVVHFPEKRPIHFALSADGSPMNSFWIPQLSGQIYAMSGMVTSLHVMADGEGTYRGQAAEINGKGYARMTFVAKSSTNEHFERWVNEVKSSPLKLTEQTYNALLTPSHSYPQTLYSSVEGDLFHHIVMKYMAPHE